MKNLFPWMLTLLIAAGAADFNRPLRAQFFEEAGAQQTIVTIHADGSCQLESRSTQGRKIMEQQLRMMERFQGLQDADDVEAAQKAAAQPGAGAKPFTDEELKQKILEMKEAYSGEAGAEAGEEPKVELTKEDVIISTKAAFHSPGELLQSRSLLIGGGFSNLRLEQDTNGHLRATFTGQTGTKRYLKSMRSAWKVQGMKSEFKLVLPGKVLSSGFTGMETNATWLVVDSSKDESLDAYLKVLEAPAVIIAETGGLVITEPLDSRKLRRASIHRGAAGDDLPLTGDGAGFVAQPEGVVTTTVHVFPAGTDYFKEEDPSGHQPGAVVTAKVFPPKGRTIQSLSGLRILKASDDKGRAIDTGEAAADEDVMTIDHFSGGGGQNNSMQVELRLQLPQPDAQAIDELNAEAVAVTAGGWKETTLTNISEVSTNEFDLGAVLPGAKLTITKVVNKNNMLRIDAELKGPPAIKRLDVLVKTGGLGNQFPSPAGERRFNAKGAASTRAISVNAMLYDSNGGTISGPFTLQVRFPEDLRREKIRINLKGIDLL